MRVRAGQGAGSLRGPHAPVTRRIRWRAATGTVLRTGSALRARGTVPRTGANQKPPVITCRPPCSRRNSQGECGSNGKRQLHRARLRRRSLTASSLGESVRSRPATGARPRLTGAPHGGRALPLPARERTRASRQGIDCVRYSADHFFLSRARRYGDAPRPSSANELA